jgi:hypothetical protein
LVREYACSDAGCFWNHTDKRHFTLYDDRIANDVCQSVSHHSLAFWRFRTR